MLASTLEISNFDADSVRASFSDLQNSSFKGLIVTKFRLLPA